MKIAVGSDHAGFDEPPPFYKPEIVAHIQALGHEVIDCGTDSAEAVDYPDVAEEVSQKILGGEAEVGILMCGTGIGMSITANRHKGVRAAVCTSEEMGGLSREHNDANVLCIGRRVLTLEACKKIIDTWLEIPFSGAERHQRRVKKMG